MKKHTLKKVTEFDFELTQIAKRILKTDFTTSEKIVKNENNIFVIYSVKIRID